MAHGSDEYFEGREAYSEDKDITDCPHEKGTQAYADWKQGWQDALDNDPLADDFQDSDLYLDDAGSDGD